MTLLFPFSDAFANRPLKDGETVLTANLELLSATAAQAADGTLWSDAAIVKSFRKSTVSGGGSCIFWDAFSRRWINAYVIGGNPAALWSYCGRDEWLSLTIPAGTNWFATASGASNGAGAVILGGGGGSATASKIRQSADGGATWNARSTNASGTEQVTCAVWHPAASLFVIGLSSSVATNVETSPDGVTWTQQTVNADIGTFNTQPRGAMASSGSTIVALSSASTNKNVLSVDGVNWVESDTLPAIAVWNAVAWNARSGKFMAIGVGVIATSLDGATWSAVGLTAPFGTATYSLCSWGRYWIAVGQNAGTINFIAISKDDGVTWTPVCSLASAGVVIAAGDSQVMAAIINTVYSTARGGL